MPDYLLYIAYGLLTVGVVACLSYIANSFEAEDEASKRVDVERENDARRGPHLRKSSLLSQRYRLVPSPLRSPIATTRFKGYCGKLGIFGS